MEKKKGKELDDIHSNIEITGELKSINNKLKLLNKKIDNISLKKDDKSHFLLNLLVTLIILMVAITIPLLTEYFDYSKEQLLLVIGCYFVVLIALLILLISIEKKLNFKL